MSKYDRNGVKHDGWVDVGRANRGELNKDSNYQKKLKDVKERKNTPPKTDSWWIDDEL